ncbi:hypothetical protein pEaSNUABM23_00253 [Erwinia phage pEa_SNUABM_23]|uniref:Uncharacterized protein n=1 Tax=Erwinia phage pEa_SNUABM_3 TaxID=2869552 RepID=A0AAE7XI11_9CAUD|nr:hypothetical protein MPK68_gp255 [Erwinia phage pEa_SNUABM_3]QZE56452.1 hypothetical protein pEaSNUABM3_00255 [Erwinia phage pEa_SNUABM_3]QZE56790.1 hypothetical protein pEaSNUABM20_00254 [Erwinia phage pEa_SNUABM_20]UAW53035.1 hypothetical protein pEaSNUABM23_00253 [Erwinia phage pEa_SNUABM_23]UIW10930.1 hypothetical protein pEaSNUABM23_00253 [Erwinia phage pEa_SNUABM_31]
MVYEREELQDMPLDVLYHLACAKGLLDDLDDEDDVPDREVLVGMILDAQSEDEQAEQNAADKQRAEDDRDPRINRRDGQDGSEDYC